MARDLGPFDAGRLDVRKPFEGATATIRVRFTREFRVRMRVACWLVALAYRILGARIEIVTVGENDWEVRER